MRGLPLPWAGLAPCRELFCRAAWSRSNPQLGRVCCDTLQPQRASGGVSEHRAAPAPTAATWSPISVRMLYTTLLLFAGTKVSPRSCPGRDPRCAALAAAPTTAAGASGASGSRRAASACTWATRAWSGAALGPASSGCAADNQPVSCVHLCHTLFESKLSYSAE